MFEMEASNEKRMEKLSLRYELRVTDMPKYIRARK
jgi:hypothetical protein